MAAHQRRSSVRLRSQPRWQRSRLGVGPRLRYQARADPALMVMMSSSKSRRRGVGVIICLVLAAAAAGAWTWWERTTRLRIVETCRRTVQLVGWYLFTYSDNGRNPACRYAFDEAVAKAHRICPGAVDVVDTYRGTISEPPSLAQLPPDLGKDLITLAVYESMMQNS